jgi:hypothetical protein
VKISISKNAAKVHLAHGDLPVAADGSCPKGTKPGGGGTTTGTTTTTTTTTTTATP